MSRISKSVMEEIKAIETERIENILDRKWEVERQLNLLISWYVFSKERQRQGIKPYDPNCDETGRESEPFITPSALKLIHPV